MKIKEIILYGFKSFPGETKIFLNSGVTAFVGPNGSGKSNIFDALRWVFGEQSMKALRCEKIEDLIYVSADTMNDASFTEVSVIIENEDYFPQFGGEFEIKRRFYKTGESEFFLNRVKCRLQDIQALFLNSGTLTYSFLELSEIEKIIQGETKEMFDDVSGILKYQDRREQTKRRLEATEQDLLRLEDIIAEMQRGLRSLKRQVRQTRLYQELKEERKNLSLYLTKNEYNTTVQELSRVQDEINNQETQRQNVLQEIKKLEKEREMLKNEMAHVEIMKKETLGKISIINETINDLQNKLAVKDEEAKQVILSCERVLTSIREKEELINNSCKRLTEMENTRTEILDKIAQLDYEIGDKRKQLDYKNERFFALKDAFKKQEDILTEFLNKIHLSKDEISKLQFEKKNTEAVLARIHEEYEVQKREIDNQRKIKKDLENELNTVIVQQAEAVAQLSQANEKLSDSEKKLAELEADLQKRQEAMTDSKIVIDTLTHRLQEKGSNKEIEKRFDKKIKGLFRNNLEVTAGYESIVDICLGDLLNCYLLTNYELQDFDKIPEGRFGFIRLKVTTEKKNPPEIPEGLSPLTQFVKFKSEQNFLQNFIASYFLVNDFNTADELSRKYNEHGFVTPDGILFKNGTIVVEKGAIGYFKISETLKQEKKKLETLQNELLFVLEEKKRLSTEIEALKKQIEEEKNGLFTINISKSEYSLKLSEATGRLEKLNKENNALKQDRDHLSKNTEALNIQINKAENETAGLEKECENIGSKKNDLNDDMVRIQEEIDEKNSLLNELTIESVVLAERRSSTEKAIERSKNENKTIELEVAKLKENTEAKNLDALNELMKSIKEELETQKRERTEYEAKLPERLIDEFNQRQNAIYDQLTQKQKTHEENQNAIMQFKYQSFQLTHKKEELVKKIKEEFDIDLPNYVPEVIIDAEAKLIELKGKLERLGEINPLSLELHENEKKRLDEFFAQRNDIITAKGNLLKSIEELDQRAQDRFIDVFQQVKREFNFVFANFFEGGEADLMLTDPANPLTSQVEIVVRMKGKRLKMISQLSGGERTLLAISLLLAFYLVKPAPFCILDEIDAPLDDANVVRFNKFLRNLSQRTQVVIITHNRATMEYADYLYGLTMERPGQSKVVSARLADLEKIGVEAEASTE